VKRLSAAISHQILLKTLEASGQRLSLAIVFAAQFATASFASDSCSHKVWKWTVNKKQATELQHFSNEGHEPWRMGDVDAVTRETIANRKKDWTDHNIILWAPAVISKSGDTATMVAQSQDRHICYQDTLRKYSWLLQPAHNEWQWIIWLPASVERADCPTQPH
jgi:hypothetical protein